MRRLIRVTRLALLLGVLSTTTLAAVTDQATTTIVPLDREPYLDEVSGFVPGPDDGAILTTKYEVLRFSNTGQVVAVRRLPAGSGRRAGVGDLKSDDRGRLLIADDAEFSRTPAFRGLRLLPDGTPDRSFGSAGFSPILSRTATASSIAETANSGVVLGGTEAPEPGKGFVIAELTAEGHPDGQFNTGKPVTIQFAAGESSALSDLLPLADGRVLAAGVASSTSRGEQIALARLLRDGRLDPGFGTGGRTILPIPAGVQLGGGPLLALQRRPGHADRVVLALGTGDALTSPATPGNAFALMRLNNNGALDSTFGNQGTVVTPAPAARLGRLLVLSDGRIVLGGANSSSFVLLRYASDGSLDPGFGAAGRLCSQLGAFGDESYMDGLGLDAGRLIAAGTRYEDDTSAAIVRYGPDAPRAVDCLDLAYGHVRPAAARATYVEAVLGHRARFAIDVDAMNAVNRPTLLGRVNFGVRGPGLVRLRWNLRVHGRQVNIFTDEGTNLIPVVLNARGRTLATGEPLFTDAGSGFG
jgi:uncharacterized delta-60 repeat protein